MTLSMLIASSFLVWAETTSLKCDADGNMTALNSITHAAVITPNDRAHASHRLFGDYCEQAKVCEDASPAVQSTQDMAKILSRTLSTPGESVSPGSLLAMQSHLQTCYANRSAAAPSATLRIDYPWKGPNQKIKSFNYGLEKIKKIVAMALLAGIDPNLVLAITLIESPPLRDQNGIAGYEHGYGDIPLDGFPLLESLGCFRGRKDPVAFSTAAEAESARPIYQRYQAAEAARASAGDAVEQFRSKLRDRSDYLQSGETMFEVVQRAVKEGCPLKGVPTEINAQVCTDAKVKSGLLAYANADAGVNAASSAIDTYVGGLGGPTAMRKIEFESRFLDGQQGFIAPPKSIKTVELPWSGGIDTAMCAQPRAFHHGAPVTFEAGPPSADACCVNVKGFASHLQQDRQLHNGLALDFIKRRIKLGGSLNDISHAIQSFNGRGCLGCTEKVANSCLDRMDTRKSPIYGARAADLMVNSLLSNNELQSVIRDMASAFSLKIKSAFCQQTGAKDLKIDNSIFYAQQKKMLLGDPVRSAKCATVF